MGHEMTQIVPFVQGHASYHKTRRFNVGGQFVDCLIQNYAFEKAFGEAQKFNLLQDNLHFSFDIRRKVKE
jgi:actin-related protein